MTEHIHTSFREAERCLREFLADATAMAGVEKAIAAIADAFRAGGKVLSCGNGGSMSDAMHFAEEFSGRFRSDRPPLPALAISDPGHLTCVANDYGYDRVFARQVEALGRSGDVLLAISTSGNSPNVLEAAKQAKMKGMHVIGLMGREGGELKGLCDIPIIVPGKTTDRMQELHIKIIHVMIEGVERILFPGLYQ
jgi:D-sedoheptulose 7-phosphate isomerase